jgi:hypothetical protein
MSDVGQIKIRPFQKSDVLLIHGTESDDSPQLQYKPQGDKTDNTHAGQMKLMLADEMSILDGLRHIFTKYKITLDDVKKNNVAVVVAGAAPGDHFVNLSTTFGFLDFHLYDPCGGWGWNPVLSAKVNEMNTNVHVYTQLFLEKTAEQWKERSRYKYVIFLCDLRTGNGHDNAQVTADMNLQKTLTETIQADYSVLKFRPPYYQKGDPRYFPYLEGQVYFQAYAPKNSSETRLHVTNTESIKMYDIEKYENQLFFHNQETRNKTKNLYTVDSDVSLSYDNAYARFVKSELQKFAPGLVILERGVLHPHRTRRNQDKILDFKHDTVRALLEHFKYICD